MRDVVLLVGVALCAGGLGLGAPVETALAGAAVLALLLLRTGARWRVALATLALALGYGRGMRALGQFEADRAAVVDAGGWPARCAFVGEVVRSPALVGGGYRVVLDATGIRCGETALAGRIALHLPAESAVPARGDHASGAASLAPPYRFWNDGVGDPRPASARRGVLLSGGAEDFVVARRGIGPRAWIDRARTRLRERIVATFPADTAPMARALVLGEDDLVEADARAFRRSGLAHLLAVSGMHLVLVVMGLVAALRALLVRVPPVGERFEAMRFAAAIGIPFAWLYADLAGGSGSAVRAAWMCTVVLLARALGRRAEPWRALGLSLLAMSLADPLVAFDVSCVLSALATAGLLGLAPPIAGWLERRVTPWIAKPLATTAAATIACAPVLTTIAPEIALGGLVANIVAVPLGEAAALPLCLLHGLLEIWPDAERGCAIAASGALVLVRLVAHAFTWGTIPVPVPTAGQLAALAIAAAGAALSARPRSWLGAGVLVVVGLELLVRARGAPHGVLRATFIDVGQGDAALVDLPDGTALLIDGGGLVGSPVDVGERAVGALLAARRRTRLRAVVLSHPHPDHFLGLSSALARVQPDALWDTGQGEDEGTAGGYAALLGELRARGVPVVHPRDLCGARELGGAIVEVLAPCPGPTVDRGANDNSFVIRVRYGARSLLFVGDAEHTEEAELLARSANVAADVLKVGHHGSRTSSSPAFLAAVHPSAAVVSCGVRNRFGHPHPSTIANLAAAGIRVLRTDQEGSVVVTTDGAALAIRSARRPR